MAKSIPALMEEFERLSLERTLEWLRTGQPRPDQKALVVNGAGDAIAVLLSPEEYEAMVAFINLANNPERLAEYRASAQKIRDGRTLPLRDLR
jgi:PHD/YefM family antitoxin component YafN of YafNO toxin-antitoxin module